MRPEYPPYQQPEMIGHTCAPANDRDLGFRCTRRTSFCPFMTITLADGLGSEGVLPALSGVALVVILTANVNVSARGLDDTKREARQLDVERTILRRNRGGVSIDN